MRAASRVFVLAAALSAGVGARGTAVSTASTRDGPPRRTAAEQTHPSVLPRTGRAGTRFAATLTLADAPGHSGVLAIDYRLQLRGPPGHDAQRCAPGQPSIQSGFANEVVRIPLIAPRGGWCTGRYTLTIFLQRGPYCPAPSPGQPPPPCPEFATQELEVGHTSFVVTNQR